MGEFFSRSIHELALFIFLDELTAQYWNIWNCCSVHVSAIVRLQYKLELSMVVSEWNMVTGVPILSGAE